MTTSAWEFGYRTVGSLLTIRVKNVKLIESVLGRKEGGLPAPVHGFEDVLIRDTPIAIRVGWVGQLHWQLEGMLPYGMEPVELLARDLDEGVRAHFADILVFHHGWGEPVGNM